MIGPRGTTGAGRDGGFAVPSVGAAGAGAGAGLDGGKFSRDAFCESLVLNDEAEVLLEDATRENASLGFGCTPISIFSVEAGRG